MSTAADILILSNGPGELTTWVRPVLEAIRSQNSHLDLRTSLILSPCPNATGKEVEIGRSLLAIDRIQGSQHFWKFLLSGKTAQNWDWREKGLVLFLGGDQAFTPIIARRLAYQSIVYAEWDIRWWRWIDKFAVMKPETISRIPHLYASKCTVIGDLMADVTSPPTQEPIKPYSLLQPPLTELIALLPGSKMAKLVQGVPLTLAIAQYIHQRRPQTQFIIPVAPTVEVSTIAQLANPEYNPILSYFPGVAADLQQIGDQFILQTKTGLNVSLYTQNPAYPLLSRCCFAVTTVGANTAELGALAIPMVVLLPSYQLDAMRAWDGIPGILANLPGVGGFLAKGINSLALSYIQRTGKLLAWPNIWAGSEIVPEFLGRLQPEFIGDRILEYLQNPHRLQTIRDRLRQVRGQPGASQKLANMVLETLSQ
ncbi:MAG: lipid-A-disaccharide synthase [Limnospira maxima]